MADKAQCPIHKVGIIIISTPQGFQENETQQLMESIPLTIPLTIAQNAKSLEGWGNLPSGSTSESWLDLNPG